MTLDEVQALKEELSAESEPVAGMSLLQKRIDTRRMNGFLRSIMHRPMRDLPQIFSAREPLLVSAALSGHSLKLAAVPALHILQAQSADEETEPSFSIGYSAVAKNDYQLEVRLQSPDVATVLLAQEVVQRARGQARVAEYRELKAHARTSPKSDPPSLSIGDSIGHPKTTPGTLGLFMRSPGGIGVFSNSHVLACSGRAKRGDTIFVPPSDDSPDALKIGQLQFFSNLAGGGVLRHDAAFATIGDGIKHNGNEIPPNLPDTGKKVIKARTMPEPGKLKVNKIGRSSRQTTGTFQAIGVDPKLEFPRLGQIKLTGMLEILWDSPKKPFSQAGDSGSVVYRPDTMEAIGIVVGGGVRLADGKREGVTIVCPLEPVMTEWNLSPV